MASQATSSQRPKANRQGLIVEESGREVLVYDAESHYVHSLNDSAAHVWRLCTGSRTVEQIAIELEIPLESVARELVVRDTIAQLRRRGLVEGGDVAPNAPDRLSRRELARKIGIGVAAAVALPLITSIVAPPAYAAASCGALACSGTTPHCCCNPGCHCTANCGAACPGKVTCT